MNRFRAWINHIVQRSLPYKATCICIIPLFIFAIYYFSIGNKQRLELQRLKYEESKLAKTIHDIQAVLVKPEIYDDQMNQLKMLQENIELQCQLDFTLLNLLYALSEIGSDLGLTYLSIDPGEQQVFEFYATFTINISLVGHFQQLLHYISQLFALNFLITITQWRMNPIVAEQNSTYYQTDESLPIELTMTIVVYRFD